MKFGSAVASENRDDEVVSIPGIRGREPKEISFKNLASIIQARLEEIFDLVNYEIQKVNSEHKLIAGIVLTGGGAMMNHIQQLAEFKTGLEVRIGYPNEYLANETSEDLASPMYATGIGLVIEGMARYEHDLIMEQKSNSANEPIKSPLEPKPVDKGRDGKSMFGRVITGFTQRFFKPDNLDNDINSGQ